MAIIVSDNIRDTATANLVSALNAQLGVSASLHVFDGSTPPATTDPDLGTELVVCAMDTTPFAAPSGNVFVANTIAPGTAVATSNPTYWRMMDGSSNVIMQGSAGNIGGEDIVFDNGTITSGDTVTITSLEFTVLVNG